MTSHYRNAVTAVGLLAGFILWATAGLANGAVRDSVTFQIEAQPVSPALKAFADQARMQLLYSEADVTSLMTPGVTGTLDPKDALAILLKGTGLGFEITPDDVIVIRRRAMRSAALTLQTGSTESSAVAAGATSTAAAAAESNSPESMSNSVKPDADVIVTGTSIEETLPGELSRYGNRMQFISSDQVRQQNLNGLAQVVQSLGSSVALNTYSGAFDHAEVSLQGSRTSDVLWLVDGVRMNNRLFNSVTPLDTMSAHMIERIEILEGGQGLHYGTQAVAGVINVVTKAFSNEFDAQLTVSGGTFTTESYSGFLRGNARGNQFVFYGSYDHADGYSNFFAEDYQPSATDRERGYLVNTGGFKYAYDFTDSVRFSAGYERTYGKLDSIAPFQTNRAFDERYEDIANAKVDFNLSEQLQLFVKAYYHKRDSYWTDYRNSPTTPGLVVPLWDRANHYFEDQGVNVLAKISPGKGLEYHVGYDLQSYRGEDFVVRIDAAWVDVHSLFAQIRSTPDMFERARFALGVRANDVANEAEYIWNATGQYDITDNFFVRTNVGTNFRLPDARELNAIDPLLTLGNPDLKPERSQNANLSIGGNVGSGPTLNWELIGFYRIVEDLIRAQAMGGGSAQFQNSDAETIVEGAQLSLDAWITPSLSANVSYSWSSAKDKATDLQIDNVPEDSGRAGLFFRPAGSRFSGSVTANYFGKAYLVLGGGLGRQLYGDYITFDVNGALYLDQRQHHSLSLRLANVLDEHYATRVRLARNDVGNTAYVAHFRGQPFMYQVSYSYSY